MKSLLAKNFSNQRRLTPTGGKEMYGVGLSANTMHDGDRRQQEGEQHDVQREIGRAPGIERLLVGRGAHASPCSPDRRARMRL